MSPFFARASVVVLTLAAFVAEGIKSHVVTLTESNFDAQVAKGKWIVTFHAPWCGHCKHLMPVLNEVARTRLNGVDVTLGKVDVTLFPSFKSRFNIQGFPTVEYLENGKSVGDFEIGRDVESIAAFATRVDQPLIRPFGTNLEKLTTWLDQDSKERKLARDPVSFVILSQQEPDPESKEWQAILEIAGARRTQFLFASAWGEDVQSWICQKQERQPICDALLRGGQILIRYEPDDVPRLFRGDLAEVDSVVSWLFANKVPLFSEVGQHNYNALSQIPGRMLVLTMYDPAMLDSKVETLAHMRRLAKGFGDVPAPVLEKLTFAHLDGVRWSKFVTDYGLTLEALPCTMVLDYEGSKFYLEPEAPEGTSIEAFLIGATEGTLPSHSAGLGLQMRRLWRAFMAAQPYSSVFALLLIGLGALLVYFGLLAEDTFDFEDDEEETVGTPTEESKKAQ